jgi:SAM-dependent methyltransferase
MSPLIGQPADDGQRHSRRLFDEQWTLADPLSPDAAEARWEPLSDPGNRRRVEAIAEVCPQVDTLLDVGCGSGDVLAALAGRARRRYGCDTSLVGLQVAARRIREAGAVVLSSADRLPFRDRAFELVACCDVLEHLPEPLALQAVRELMRVAGRYVLINVPIEEDLAWSEIACAACGHIYHRDHHKRSYRQKQVEELLPACDFRLAAVRTTGWIVRRLGRLPPGLGAALGLGHDPSVRCERCGARPAPLSRARRFLRDAFVLCHNALCKPLAGRLSRDSEIVVLFARIES